MPELPEVEVTRQSFAARIAGAHITAVRLGKPLRWPLGCAPGQLLGQQVLGVRRRGKYLLLDLSDGLLLLHLGMSGSLRFAPALPAPGAHDHFDLVTDHGLLRLHDPRRFGAAVFTPGEQSAPARKLLGALGLEPLDDGFTPAALQAGLVRHRAPIKQVLLAGKVVVGVGNIYASEVLFLAGIRPTTAACALGPVRVRRLHRAIREVLARAVARGGTTLRDFSSAEGQAGHFQTETRVYGRAGQPCTACGAAIHSLVQGQRSSFYCPRCQRP
ncbi:MAG: bifunctional DNA-formamidopyrimidine glycosylase/DNA-(apurinic or apyrimidinic site) lyase [Comamonadaceae bacterium]|nr:bifunctional DNA-formamidopyrimidine glycosylase/DNA-(apurinic or apyrimidinic site) lyase [Comamonadaceae bacterium]